jgi:hypothetical protein
MPARDSAIKISARGNTQEPDAASPLNYFKRFVEYSGVL